MDWTSSLSQFRPGMFSRSGSSLKSSEGFEKTNSMFRGSILNLAPILLMSVPTEQARSIMMSTFGESSNELGLNC